MSDGLGFDGFDQPDYLRGGNNTFSGKTHDASNKRGDVLSGNLSTSQSENQVFNYETGEYSPDNNDDYQVKDMPASLPNIPVTQTTYPNSPAVPPNFTFPINRGEGSNINAYTEPANFTQNGEGDYQAGMPVSTGAYAGSEIKDYVDPSRLKYRDAQGQGGWGYRQFADGTIQILVSPQPKLLPVGTYLKGVNGAPGYKYWEAITNEIGTWSAYAKNRNINALRKAAEIAITVSSAKGKQKKAKKNVKVVKQVIQEPVDKDDSEGEDSGIPTWAYVVGGVALLAGGVWLASRNSGNKDKVK